MFSFRMSDFLADCAERIIVLGIVHRRIINRFKKFAAWLGIPIGKISTSKPNEVFKTISEFALEYRTTRDRVIQQIKKINREKNKIKEQQSYNSNATVCNSYKTILGYIKDALQLIIFFFAGWKKN